ncbi:MAG: Bax inhibitor-1/YccA family protein [Alphaproteobacteria bacterium]
MENRSTVSRPQSTTMDVGLRAHMGRVYNRMTLGVLVTAITAALVASSPALMKFFLGGPQMYIVIFAPLAVVWFGFNPSRMNSKQLAMSFFALAVLYGISFSTIGIIFTKESIAQVFFIATAMFAGLSIFGYTTRKNLDGMGSFLIMGVWGLLIASLVNMFFMNPGVSQLLSYVGVAVFAGLTAWQTQMTKEMYHPGAGDEANSRMAWSATLNLYISFIAMFQYLIQIFGQRN